MAYASTCVIAHVSLSIKREQGENLGSIKARDISAHLLNSIIVHSFLLHLLSSSALRLQDLNGEWCRAQAVQLSAISRYTMTVIPVLVYCKKSSSSTSRLLILA